MKMIWNPSFPAHKWDFIGMQSVHCLHIVCGCFHIANAELNGVDSQYLWPLCSVKSPGILNQQYWATAPKGNTGWSSCKPLATFLLADQYITLLYVCFHLKTHYLMYLVDYHWTYNQEHYNPCLKETYPICAFSLGRHIRAFLHFGTLSST